MRLINALCRFAAGSKRLDEPGGLPNLRWGALQSSPSASRRQLPQGSLEIREVPRAERLDPGVVVAVESGHGPRTARVRGIRGRVEPQTQMERMDRLGRRIRVSIREWRLVVHDGSFLVAWRLR